MPGWLVVQGRRTTGFARNSLHERVGRPPSTARGSESEQPAVRRRRHTARPSRPIARPTHGANRFGVGRCGEIQDHPFPHCTQRICVQAGLNHIQVPPARALASLLFRHTESRCQLPFPIRRCSGCPRAERGARATSGPALRDSWSKRVGALSCTVLVRPPAASVAPAAARCRSA